MRNTLSARLLSLLGAGALLVACGDNLRRGDGDDVPDSGDDVPDMGETPDMGVDVVTGSITFLEASVLGAPQAGQGLQVSASFFENGGVPPVLEEQPGSPLGCKVWEYTAAEAADLGLDEGTIDITVDTDPDTAGNQGPVTPTCRFIPTQGYRCPDTQSMGGTIAGAPNPATPGACLANMLMLTDTDGPFTFAVTDGRYITFTGTGNAMFPDGLTVPIVNKLSDQAIWFAYPGASTTCLTAVPLPETATMTTLGGVGPIPGVVDPGLLADDAHVSITLTAGGDNRVPSFTADFPAPAGPGNDFTLTTESEAVLADLPLDGSAFTLGCDATTGCGDGSGDGVLINIVTTDGSIAGLPGTSMPPPATKRVQVRCAALAATEVSVSAAASAYLMNSGATRIQATFIRGELSGNPEGTVNVVAGHAIVGFNTPTP